MRCSVANVVRKSMKTRTPLTASRGFQKLLAAGLVLLPALASAHPGHYHPEEHDEFDALRANFLHLHGNLEIGLLVLAAVCAITFHVSRSRPLRIAAALACGGALAMFAAH